MEGGGSGLNAQLNLQPPLDEVSWIKVRWEAELVYTVLHGEPSNRRGLGSHLSPLYLVPSPYNNWCGRSKPHMSVPRPFALATSSSSTDTHQKQFSEGHKQCAQYKSLQTQGLDSVRSSCGTL